jgi:hypothetical protein
VSYFSPAAQPVYKASANVRPARLLAKSSGTAETAAEATGNTLPFVGVSANRYKFAPGGYEQTAVPYLAQTGDGIDYRGPGMVAQVLSGAAVSNLGRPLGSDGSGRAVSVTPGQTTGGTYIAGYPVVTAAAADEVIEMVVIFSIPILV